MIYDFFFVPIDHVNYGLPSLHIDFLYRFALSRLSGCKNLLTLQLKWPNNKATRWLAQLKYAAFCLKCSYVCFQMSTCVVYLTYIYTATQALTTLRHLRSKDQSKVFALRRAWKVIISVFELFPERLLNYEYNRYRQLAILRYFLDINQLVMIYSSYINWKD